MLLTDGGQLHLAFALEGLLGNGGIVQDVADDFDGGLDIGAEDARRDSNAVVAGREADVAPAGFDLARDLFRVPAFGALEKRACAELRDAAAKLATDFALQLVVWFGSAARGESAVEDIDIGVLGSHPVDVVDVTNALTRSLLTQTVDVTDLMRADPILLALVARDGVPLFENAPGVFTRFASLAACRFADTKKFRDAQERALREATSRSPAP